MWYKLAKVFVFGNQFSMRYFFILLFFSTSPLFAIRDSQWFMLQPQGPKTAVVQEEYNAAISEAAHFLGLLDQGQQHAAWGDSSNLMQDIVGRDIWSEGVRAVRSPLGLLTGRKTVSHKFFNNMPSGITGKFVTISFDSQFAKGAARHEEVILIATGGIDAVIWRVISYAIR